MKLEDCYVSDSPEDTDRVRLTGKVTYDDNNVSELYWFEVAKKYEPFLSGSGNPWLVCLLPLAVTLGEPLKLCLPVDSTLYKNAQELMLIWKSWYPHLHIVPIQAEIAHNASNNTAEIPDKTGAFFSGGVDAFFTALRHLKNSVSNQDGAIDDLLLVWGFDIPLKNKEGFRRKLNSLEKAAEELNTNLIWIKTNMRETRLETAQWGWLYNASALASVGLILEKRYRQLLIGSTFSYEDLHPWGSTPLTDPLSSTSQTQIVHDDAKFDRTEKITYIANSATARKYLHVCFMTGSDNNCSQCNKCYRTMAVLLLLGVLPEFRTFNMNKFEVGKLGKVYFYDNYDRLSLLHIQKLALEKGRYDMEKAIEKSFRYNDMMQKFLPVIKRGKESKAPPLRYIAYKIENLMFRNAILS